MSVFTDGIGNQITLSAVPKRIVSLVPSQTELLSALGLDEEVFGITKFCVHPVGWLKQKGIIGGTKNLNLEKIRRLNPDLILANKEENNPDQVKALAEEFPVFTTDVASIEDNKALISDFGKLLRRESAAKKLLQTLNQELEKLDSIASTHNVLYLIWKDPYMGVGGDTFISSVLKSSGFKNIQEEQTRYPEIDLELLKTAQLDFIFLSSEPYPFKENHIEEIEAFLPKVKIVLVDGEMFSWYGSRLSLAPAYILELRKKLGLGS